MKEELMEQMKMIYEIMGSEEFTDAVADFCWKMFTKLTAKGFSQQEAITILSSMTKAK